MRARGRPTARFSWSIAIQFEDLEDRRLMSGIHGIPDSGDRPTASPIEVSTPSPGEVVEVGQAGGNSSAAAIGHTDLADVLAVHASNPVRSGTGLDGDSSGASTTSAGTEAGVVPRTSEGTTDAAEAAASDAEPAVIHSSPISSGLATYASYIGGTDTSADGISAVGTDGDPADAQIPTVLGPVDTIDGTALHPARGMTMSRETPSVGLFSSIDGAEAPSALSPWYTSWESPGGVVTVIGMRHGFEGQPGSNEPVLASAASLSPDIDGEPDPSSSGLLTDFLPFERRSLEAAIDRFLDQFESLGADLTDWRSPTELLPMLTAVAVTAVASEVLRRRRQRDEANAADGDRAGGFGRFPGLQPGWGFGES